MINTIKQCMKKLLSKCCGGVSVKNGKPSKTPVAKKPAEKKTNS